MDVKIENRDIAIHPNGDPQYISGIDEVVQRVVIACSLRKGDFRYDRELGCFDYTIDLDDELMCDKMTMIFKEATVDIGYTDLEVLKITQSKDGYIARVKIQCGDETKTAEVSLYE